MHSMGPARAPVILIGPTMSDFSTTGRPMSGTLARALDSVTARDRRLFVAALRATDGLLAPLHRALATELELCGLREAETDAAFRAILSDDALDDRPWPQPPTGPGMRFDPESGEF